MAIQTEYRTEGETEYILRKDSSSGIVTTNIRPRKSILIPVTYICSSTDDRGVGETYSLTPEEEDLVEMHWGDCKVVKRRGYVSEALVYSEARQDLRDVIDTFLSYTVLDESGRKIHAFMGAPYLNAVGFIDDRQTFEPLFDFTSLDEEATENHKKGIDSALEWLEYFREKSEQGDVAVIFGDN